MEFQQLPIIGPVKTINMNGKIEFEVFVYVLVCIHCALGSLSCAPDIPGAFSIPSLQFNDLKADCAIQNLLACRDRCFQSCLDGMGHHW